MPSGSARRSTLCRSRAGARSMYHDETGVPWVIPSPNLPTLDSAIVYPGAVLFEGTRLSEGRGTTRPFELIGAPWIDGERLADAMNARGLPGCAFPACVLRADIPEAREADLRRVPAARRRSTRVSSGADGGRIDGGVPPRRTRRVSPGASLPTSTSTTSSRSTFCTARPGFARLSTAAATSVRSSPPGHPRKKPSGGRGNRIRFIADSYQLSDISSQLSAVSETQVHL